MNTQVKKALLSAIGVWIVLLAAALPGQSIPGIGRRANAETAFPAQRLGHRHRHLSGTAGPSPPVRR